MTLLLDIGNTRFKWAWLGPEGGLRDIGALDHRDSDAEVLLRAAQGAAEPPGAVFMSNVGGEQLGLALQAAMRTLWRLQPVVVTATAEAGGVQCAYRQPGRLGADRWAALIGARALCAGRVAILDFGTATTLDVLDADGRHLGGLIAPGYRLMHHSLFADTQDIAAAAGRSGDTPETPLLAIDTATAVAAGVTRSARGLVQEVLRELEVYWPDGYTLLVTGGDSHRMQPVLPASARIEPNLVLHGLARLAREDRES